MKHDQRVGGAACALGLELSKAGRPADVQTLLSSIEGSAARILELEAQVRLLQAGADPALAAQLVKASGAIEAVISKGPRPSGLGLYYRGRQGRSSPIAGGQAGGAPCLGRL